MKHEPVTKLDKRNTTMPKKFDDDIMSANCDIIFFLPIYGQFAAMQKPDSGRMVLKTNIFINNNLFSYKN